MTLRRLLSKLRRRPSEREMQDEFDAHLALHVDDNLRAGMNLSEARRQALLKFGGVEATKEAYREAAGLVFFEQTAQDMRYALRGFRRSPAFAVSAVATLSIGIGASVAVFSAVDPLLFRALPYPHDEQLVSFGYFGPIDTNEFAVVASYLDWRKQPGPFQSMTSMGPAVDCDLVYAGAAKQTRCAAVEANFLATLGLRVEQGRDFTREDDRRGAPQVALISDALWRGVLRSDARVVDRDIEVDSVRYRIIGVLPADFEMPQGGDVDILRTVRYREDQNNSSAPARTFGRLREGVSLEQGRAQMEPLMRTTAVRDVPKQLQSEVRYVFQSLRDRRIHEVKAASWMLLAAVAGLLLLACANVANLLLARGAARAREMALRLAIGAGRWRLARQSLTESLLLALLACATGCALAWVLLQAFIAVAPEGLLRLQQAAINPRVAGFAVLTALGSVVVFGFVTALRIAPNKTRFRKVLVAAQVALSLVLLTGASLFAQSFIKLQNQNLGFAPEQIITASFTLRQARYNTPAAQAAFGLAVEEKLSGLGVPFALADSAPPAGGATGRPYSNMSIEGRAPLAANGGMVLFRRVTPSYFRTMQIAIVAGRAFSEEDRSGAEPLILSESLARKMFGGESPLGQRIGLGDGVWVTVIGVATDVRNAGLAQAASPEYYRLRMNDGRQVGRATVALFRTNMSTVTLAAFVQRELAALDPALPVEVVPMAARVQALQDRPRFLALLIGCFAAAGLVLSMTGLYGVLSFLVAQRRREVGVRIAVGASARHIAGIFFKQALGWTAAGVVAGTAAVYVLAGTVRSLLFEVAPHDAVSLAVAGLVLLLAALGATAGPARRAVKIDPAVALRPE